MVARVMQDSNAPTASVEMVIRHALPDYDLYQVEAETPRDVDPMLASPGFNDLIDDARAILERELAGSGLAIVQLTGAICHDSGVHRPGIWLVVEEKNSGSKQMSAEDRGRIEAAVQAVQSALGIS